MESAFPGKLTIQYWDAKRRVGGVLFWHIEPPDLPFSRDASYRAHLEAAGMPYISDLMYGSPQ